MENKPEVWMRGPIQGVPPLLQPVAHALLQAQEEAFALLDRFPDDKLWLCPMGVASVGFHLQHICGVIDRMFTYANKKPLSEQQLVYLEQEGKQRVEITVVFLLEQLREEIQKAVEQLKNIPEEELTKTRTIGRKKIPTTLIGLLFHAAEHTQRHIGQLLVTAKAVVKY